MSEFNKIDLSRFILDEKDIAGSHIDVHSEVVKGAVAKVSQLNEKTVEQALIVKQQEAIEQIKQDKQHLLAKLGAIGTLMKEQRYDEALELLPPSCEQVVREIPDDAVINYYEYIYHKIEYPGDIPTPGEYANQLRNPEQEK